MSSPHIASAAKPSLGRDWLDALRYWLRGRRGVAPPGRLGGRDGRSAQLELVGGGGHRAASLNFPAVRRDVRSRLVHEQDDRRVLLDVLEPPRQPWRANARRGAAPFRVRTSREWSGFPDFRSRPVAGISGC